MATQYKPIASNEKGKENTYTIGGVTVEFPCKAYSTQVSMMSMIIRGIERQKNCLLESPTGSGKSLALLCSCLAWQRREQKKQLEEDTIADTADNEIEDDALCKCNCKNTTPSSKKTCTATSPPDEVQSSAAISPDNIPPQVDATPKHPGDNNGTCQTPGLTPRGSKRGLISDEQDEDDFQPSKKKSKRNSTVKKKKKGVPEIPEVPEVPECEEEVIEVDSAEKEPCQCLCHSSKKDVYKRRRVPKIYFGTRTHKQIAQLIKELGKTEYKDVRMSILGSREHTCVHPVVSAGPHKNEGCKDLLDGRTGGSCQFHNGVHKIKHQWQLRERGLNEVWDIEDLVTLGKKIKACPYYATRSLKDDADIVFCPYNYLVDPIIRSTMEISLKGQIVVLDEAHNIEDSAREAASLSVTANQLEDTVDELEHHIENKWRRKPCRILHAVINALKSWFENQSSKFEARKDRLLDRALKVWSGTEMVALLRDIGVSEDTLPSLKKNLTLLLDDPEPQKKDKEEGTSLSSGSGITLKNLFVIFGFLTKDSNKFMKDYKVVIMRSQVFGKPKQKSTDDRWVTKNKRSNSSVGSWPISLNFWCLNPAVAFTDFGEDTRTIVLTSGTLSPMSSFQSELGVDFKIQHEFNHVVNMSQVWIASIAEGPNSETLNGAYKSAETYKFQDEIGRLLHQVCVKIPFGVLCFFPSYGMMDKLSKRWKNTGQWDKLAEVKVVMSETRGADKVNFEQSLREYYEVIKNLEQGSNLLGEVTGALFLAVFRGKVSEGMDFADNNARAVMTVGIPYPSIRDTQVELKQQYNDTYSTSRGLLTGSEWYEIQAYRAINQALGRCIRHRRDWGALILADHRFYKNTQKYTQGLSKWVRNNLSHHTSCATALSSLEDFALTRIQRSKYDTSAADPVPAALVHWTKRLTSTSTSLMQGEPSAKPIDQSKNKHSRTPQAPSTPGTGLSSNTAICPTPIVQWINNLTTSLSSPMPVEPSAKPGDQAKNKLTHTPQTPSTPGIGPRNKGVTSLSSPVPGDLSAKPIDLPKSKHIRTPKAPSTPGTGLSNSTDPSPMPLLKWINGLTSPLSPPMQGDPSAKPIDLPKDKHSRKPKAPSTPGIVHRIVSTNKVATSLSSPVPGDPSAKPTDQPNIQYSQTLCTPGIREIRPRDNSVPLLPKTNPFFPNSRHLIKEIIINTNPGQGQPGNKVAAALGLQTNPVASTPIKFFMSAPNTSNAAQSTLVAGPSPVPANSFSPRLGQPVQSPSVALNPQVMPGCFYAVGPRNTLIPVLPPKPMGNPAQMGDPAQVGNTAQLVTKNLNTTDGNHVNPEVTPTQPTSMQYVVVAQNTQASTMAPLCQPGVQSQTPSVPRQPGPVPSQPSPVGPHSLVTQVSPNTEPTVKSNSSGADKSSTVDVPRIQGTLKKGTINIIKTPGVGWLSSVCKSVGRKDADGNVNYHFPRGKINFDATPPTSSRGHVRTEGVEGSGCPVVDLTDEGSPTKNYVKDAQGSVNPTTPWPEEEQEIQRIRVEHNYTPPLFDSDITAADMTTDDKEGDGKGDPTTSAKLSRQLRKKGGVYFADETIQKRYKRLAFEKSLCRIGLFCRTCGKRVLLHMKGVSLIPDAALANKFSFLVNLPKHRILNPKKSRMMCWCEKDQPVPEEGFINIASSKCLKNVSVLSNKPSKGFVQNAHWSEEDQCCYQPIRCAVCEMKPDVKAYVIGYKLVAVGPNLDSALSDQVWLFPNRVGHCRGLSQLSASS
ncbi:Fanconi anemia group J protein homolog [Asterias amurensis]|uniref:Fanconi anemia group J protein homolog n=1 Tax=Asterias amurensis TaxID=7602 RepID=UPI003AB7FCD5